MLNRRTDTATTSSASSIKPRQSGWAHAPWLAGLVLAPLLHGAVNPELLAVVSALFGGSLLLLCFSLGGSERRLMPAALGYLLVLLLCLPLIPLPAAVMVWLSPERWSLEQRFPIETPRAWLAWTVSPADTVQRLWELGCLGAVFVLARGAGRDRRATRSLAWAVLIGVLLTAVADLVFRAQGRRWPAGFWENTWGQGAGTFANRNHFAGWLYVGTLFLLGWWLRAVSPLHRARTGEVVQPAGRRESAVLIAAIMLLAVVMAVLSASRAALGAFAVGLMIWGALLWRRSHQRRLPLAFLAGLLVTVGLVTIVGEPLLDRLAQTKADLGGSYPKLQIWRQAWALFGRFALCGVGPGGFLKAFGPYKTAGGSTTVYHAENDWLQAWVEHGWVGGLLGCLAVFCVLKALAAFVVRERCDEPELAFGAAAALGAFAVHACFEFVFQIPANAILAAALLGWVVGLRDRNEVTTAPPPPGRGRILANLAGGLMLLAAALAQTWAWQHWVEANRRGEFRSTAERVAQVEQSLQAWPWAPSRHLGLARLLMQTHAAAPPETRAALGERIRAGLNQALRLDPLHWELRLERAWLDLALDPSAARTHRTVLEAIRVNPRQRQIPLQFAEVVAARDPGWAREILQGVDATDPATRSRLLNVAIQLPESMELCLALAAGQVSALQALAELALERRRPELAAAAAEQLHGKVAMEEEADIYMRAGQPLRVLELLPEASSSPRARCLLGRAHLRLGRPAEAMRLAESVWQASARRAEVERAVMPRQTLAELRLAHLSRPQDVQVVRELAERLADASPPDIAALRDLAGRFPQECHVRWLVFQAEKIAQQQRAAATTALELAESLLLRP